MRTCHYFIKRILYLYCIVLIGYYCWLIAARGVSSTFTLEGDNGGQTSDSGTVAPCPAPLELPLSGVL